MAAGLSSVSADWLLLGGSVWGRPEADALAVGGGRILAVGSRAALQGCCGARTRVLELHGGALWPGFHDAHSHLTLGGLCLSWLDLKGVADPEELVRCVARRHAGLPDRRWLLGRGWDAEGWHAPPNAALLERAAPGRPVLLYRSCGHVGVASQAALVAAGLEAGSGDPPGGRLGRCGGQLDGRLFEKAVELVAAAQPEPSLEEWAEGLRQALALGAAAGITRYEDDVSPGLDVWRALQIYARLEPIPALLRLWIRPEIAADAAELTALKAELARRPHVELGALKLFLDGSLGGRTAALLEPYCDAPGDRGMLRLEQEELVAHVGAAERAGLRLAFHAIGDAAARQALDALDAANCRAGHRLEHAQLLAQADIPRLRRRGVSVSIQPTHFAQDAGFALARLGPKRLARAYPWAVFEREGLPLALGSDFPISGLGPVASLEAAVGTAGRALSWQAAVAAATWGAAWVGGMPEPVGRLVVGAPADLVVFEGPLSEPAQLKTARVRWTFSLGRRVFGSG